MWKSGTTAEKKGVVILSAFNLLAHQRNNITIRTDNTFSIDKSSVLNFDGPKQHHDNNHCPLFVWINVVNAV